MDEIEQILATERLPDPIEQSEALLLWMGEQLTVRPGELVDLSGPSVEARIGTVNKLGLLFVLGELAREGMLKTSESGGQRQARLNLAGWRRYSELRRGRSESRRGFMAMKFGNPHLTEIFRAYLRPASMDAGFPLVRLDDDPPAGSIDARLENEIRMSRFLVADLSDDNAGAYWEAGFAHGLGKPVIYMCERGIFDAKGTHFDTEHHQTIVWEKDKGAEAGEKLKQVIRATLPGEAKFD